MPPSLLCPGDRDLSVRTGLPGPGAGVRPRLHSGSSVTGAGAVASAATHPELAAHVPWPWAPQASAAGLRLHPGQAPGVLTRAEAQAVAVYATRTSGWSSARHCPRDDVSVHVLLQEPWGPWLSQGELASRGWAQGVHMAHGWPDCG